MNTRDKNTSQFGMTENNKTTPHTNYIGSLSLFLLALGVSLLILQNIEKLKYSNLQNDQLQEMLTNNVPIYDVRRADEWRKTGIIEGSQLLTFIDSNGSVNPGFINKFTTAIGKNDSVILICRTGSRTKVLARYLAKEFGYTKIFNVEDGITRWIQDKRPVQRYEQRPSDDSI